MTRTLQWGSCHSDSLGHLEVLSSVGKFAIHFRQMCGQEGRPVTQQDPASENYLSQLSVPSMRIEALTDLLSAVIAHMVRMDSQTSNKEDLPFLMEFAAHIQAAIWGLEIVVKPLERGTGYGNDTAGTIRWDGEVLDHNLACVRRGLDQFDFTMKK